MADDTTINPDSDSLTEQVETTEVAHEVAPADQKVVVEKIVVEEMIVEQVAEQPFEQGSPPEPSVANTLVIPASANAGSGSSETDPQSGEGGEWELLLAKLRQWLDQNELQNLWTQARRPVTIAAALVGLLLVLRVYSAVLSALDSLPLVPGLLELAGVVWVVRYGIPKLLRSSERDRLLGGLSQGWKAFRGKG